MAETPRGSVAGVGVRGTSTVEVKAETKYQTTLRSYLTPNNTNKPQGPLYKSTTTVKVTKVEKGEVSGKIRGVDVKASVAVKVDQATGAATAVSEASVGVGVGKKGAASGSVSVDTDGRTRNAKAGVKVETQLSDKRKASAAAGVGFSF